MSAQQIATTPTYIALVLSGYDIHRIAEITGARVATVKMKVSGERDKHPQIPRRFKRTTNPPDYAEAPRYSGWDGRTRDVMDVAEFLTADGKAKFLSIYPEWNGRL
jgi:hypothetical protein